MAVLRHELGGVSYKAQEPVRRPDVTLVTLYKQLCKVEKKDPTGAA